MVTDGHNHTCAYSPDAKQTPEQLIDSAISRGLPGIAITEHYEINNPDSHDEIQIFNLDDYYRSFKTWKCLCHDNFNLLLGIEFGYQSNSEDSIRSAAAMIPFDVVILSNHFFRGRDPYYSDSCYRLSASERNNEYISVMAQMCENLDCFDVAGHYDYINRYNPDSSGRVLYDDCPKAFDRLFEALIYKNKSLEINTRSIMKLRARGETNVMPDRKVLSRYLDMGSSMISLGSDSHTDDTLGIEFEDTCEYLKSLGFRQTVYFRQHQPVFEQL